MHLVRPRETSQILVLSTIFGRFNFGKFPGSAQTSFDAQKRKDSELLDDRLRSQGSLHTTIIPKITGMGDEIPEV